VAARRKEARGINAPRLRADFITIASTILPPCGCEWVERYEVFSWDDAEWCIMGVADGRIEELHGPFSSRDGALHFAKMSLFRLCPRPIIIVDGLGEA
jgi:hypothetical protein